MRTLVFLILGGAVIVLQTTMFHALPEWIGVPDLLVLLIVFVSIRFDVARGTLISILLGLGHEVCSGYYLGLYVIAYLLVFFVVKGLARAFAVNEANHQPPVVAAAYLGAGGVVYLCSSMLADEPLSPWGWGSVLQRLLIVIILVVPVNRLLEVVYDFFDKKERRFMFPARKGNRYRRAGR